MVLAHFKVQTDLQPRNLNQTGTSTNCENLAIEF